MGEAIGAVTERSRGILLGRMTYEMFEPAWSTRTVEDDPGRRSQRHHEVRRLRDAHGCDVEELEDHRAVRPRRDPQLGAEVDGDLYASAAARWSER